jgi:hypothetical protein
LKLKDVRAALRLDRFTGNAFDMRTGQSAIGEGDSNLYDPSLYPTHMSDMTYQDAFGRNQRMAYRRDDSLSWLSAREGLAVSLVPATKAVD